MSEYDDEELEEEMEQLGQEELNELLADSNRPVENTRLTQENGLEDDQQYDEPQDDGGNTNPIVSDQEDTIDQEPQQDSETTATTRGDIPMRNTRNPNPSYTQTKMKS